MWDTTYSLAFASEVMHNKQAMAGVRWLAGHDPAQKSNLLHLSLCSFLLLHLQYVNLSFDQELFVLGSQLMPSDSKYVQSSPSALPFPHLHAGVVLQQRGESLPGITTDVQYQHSVVTTDAWVHH